MRKIASCTAFAAFLGSPLSLGMGPSTLSSAPPRPPRALCRIPPTPSAMSRTEVRTCALPNGVRSRLSR
ncbi:hypothetical protein D3C85_1804190 [compost metagenome]